MFYAVGRILRPPEKVLVQTKAVSFEVQQLDGQFHAVGRIVRPPEEVLVQMKADRFKELPKDDASDVDIYLPETPFSCNDTRAALSWLVKCDMLAGGAYGGVVIEAAPVGSCPLPEPPELGMRRPGDSRRSGKGSGPEM